MDGNRRVLTGPNMKILMLTARLPFPPHKGDQTVAYHRLRTLGLRHRITLLTFQDDGQPSGADEALRPYCERIIKVPHPRWRIAWNLASKGLASHQPLQVLYYHSPEFQARLNELMEEDFDLVHGFLIRMRPYIEGLKRPVILECIDSMRLNLAGQVYATRGLWRLIYQEELRRMDIYEPQMDAHIAQAIFVAPLDAERSGSAKALTIPLGVELPVQAATCDLPFVGFSGNMAYGPNAIALKWFLRHCWAKIRQRHPGAEFHVFGGGCSPEIRSLACQAGVVFHGRVVDMAESLLSLRVAVAPMQSGSGMQNKILEALACGVPVVATSLGRGAIAAGPGQGLQVADSSEDTIEGVCGLLADPARCRSMGGKARRYVADHHSWERAADTIESAWAAFCRGGLGID